MSNSNGKYFFYSVSVVTAACLLVWALSKFDPASVILIFVYICSMSFFIYWLFID